MNRKIKEVELNKIYDFDKNKLGENICKGLSQIANIKALGS